MGKYDSINCRLLQAEPLNDDTFSFVLEAPSLAALAQPGQFANFRLPGHTLRRPISICEIDGQRGTLRFVFQIRGEGTAELSKYSIGDSLEILAPLGKGFRTNDKKTLLIGGGIGVPPLLGAAKELGGKAVAILGFRNRTSVILEEDFSRMGAETLIATDDGSYGFHGLVTQLAEKQDFEEICACGPMPMLRAVAKLARDRDVPCQISLEERMACGIGACLGCATPLLNEKGEQYFGHVCKDGPVFDYRKVVL